MRSLATSNSPRYIKNRTTDLILTLKARPRKLTLQIAVHLYSLRKHCGAGPERGRCWRL